MKARELRKISEEAAKKNKSKLSFDEFQNYLYINYKAYIAAQQGQTSLQFDSQSFWMIELTQSLKKKLDNDGFTFTPRWFCGVQYLDILKW